MASAVERERLDTVAATMALVMHAKLGAVLSGVESPVVLSRAADIARSVPVYALHVVRDLDRVEEVARLLCDWHADGSGKSARRGPGRVTTLAIGHAAGEHGTVRVTAVVQVRGLTKRFPARRGLKEAPAPPLRQRDHHGRVGCFVQRERRGVPRPPRA